MPDSASQSPVYLTEYSIEYRRTLLQRVALFGQLLLILHAAGMIPVYLDSKAWQVLANIILTLAGLVGLNIAYRLSRIPASSASETDVSARSLLRAGAAILLVLLFSPLANLMIRGSNIIFAAGSTFGVLVILLILRPNYWPRALIATGLYAAYFLAVNRWVPIPAYDLAGSPFARLIDAINSLVFIGLLVWQYARTIWSGGLRTRLLLTYAAIAIVPLAITGGVSSYLGQRNESQRAINYLTTVAEIQQQQISRLAAELQTSLLAEMQITPSNQWIATVMENDPNSPEYEAAYVQLHRHFQNTISLYGLFDQFQLIDADGRVVLSTNPTSEGSDVRAESYFTEALRSPYFQPPVVDPYNQEIVIYAARPVVIDRYAARPLGVIVGRLAPARLNTILASPAGLGQTGESYLISDDGLLLTPLRQPDNRRQPGSYQVTSQAASAILSDHQAGGASYTDDTGLPIFGVYRWLPELNAALLVEQQQAEVVGWSAAAGLPSIAGTAAINIGIALLSMALALLAGLLISRSIVKPIANLSAAASDISAGDMDRHAPVERLDEIGRLAQAFNHMTDRLRHSIASLETRVAERTQDLETGNQRLQAAAALITELARTAQRTTPAGESTQGANATAAAVYATAADPLEGLIDRACRLIPERLGFHYAAIYLTDPQDTFTLPGLQPGVLSRHTLPLITTHQTTPAGPTRSNGSFPSAASQIGLLDVQSRGPDAFDAQILSVLAIIADQLAIAIENVRLVKQLNASVHQLEQAQGQMTLDAWQQLLSQSTQVTGYRFHNGQTKPLSVPSPEAIQAINSGQTILHTDAHPVDEPAEAVNATAEAATTSLAVPIRLRADTIGVINLRYRGPKPPQGAAHLAEEIAARLALILENTRLLEQTRLRAAQEHLISETTAQLRASLDLDTILQTAARELTQSLNLEQATIHLTPTDPDSPHPTPGR